MQVTVLEAADVGWTKIEFEDPDLGRRVGYIQTKTLQMVTESAPVSATPAPTARAKIYPPAASVQPVERGVQSQVVHAGIQPLTPEGFEEAKRATDQTAALNLVLMNRLDIVQHGKAEPYDFVTDMPEPWKQGMMRLNFALPQVERFPFSITIETPFTRTAIIAREAKRKFADPVYPTLQELNEQLPRIVIGPGQNFTTLEDVENVVVKRGTDVIKPKAMQVAPLTIQNKLGASRTVSLGWFDFPFVAFEPSIPIEIVIVGKAQNRPWPIPRGELASLR